MLLRSERVTTAIAYGWDDTVTEIEVPDRNPLNPVLRRGNYNHFYFRTLLRSTDGTGRWFQVAPNESVDYHPGFVIGAPEVMRFCPDNGHRPEMLRVIAESQSGLLVMSWDWWKVWTPGMLVVPLVDEDGVDLVVGWVISTAK